MASSTRKKKTEEVDTCGRRPDIAVADSVEKTGSVKILRAMPMLFHGITCKMQAIGNMLRCIGGNLDATPEMQQDGWQANKGKTEKKHVRATPKLREDAGLSGLANSRKLRATPRLFATDDEPGQEDQKIRLPSRVTITECEPRKEPQSSKTYCYYYYYDDDDYYYYYYWPR